MAAAQKQAAPPDTDIIKSPQDQRQYRSLHPSPDTTFIVYSRPCRPASYHCTHGSLHSDACTLIMGAYANMMAVQACCAGEWSDGAADQRSRNG